MTLTSRERRRYARQVSIPQFGLTGQGALKSASAIVVGAGGLGSPVLMYLAAAGVGRLGIIDDDVVDESNLQRQIIHGESEVGVPKTTSAAKRLQDLNSQVRIDQHRHRLTAENALNILDGYDVVIDGSDNFATRYLVNDACVILDKPQVWASILRFQGQASVFAGSSGPCYRCLYPEPPPADQAPSCAEAGVLGIVCGTMGSLQATEAIKILAKIGTPLIGRLVVHDALESTWRAFEVHKDPNCRCKAPSAIVLDDLVAACDYPYSQVRQIAVEELNEWLSDGVPYRLLDVREETELWEGVIGNAQHFPKSQIDGGLRPDLPVDAGPLVVYCQSGIRSAAVAQAVRNHASGPVLSLTGGVNAWLKFGGHMTTAPQAAE